MTVTLSTDADVDRFVEIAKHNVFTLERNLSEIGYLFSNPDGAVQLAADQDIEEIATLAKKLGPLPRLFQRWYETFRWVDFTQDAEQLITDSGDQTAGLGMNCTLVFRDIAFCLRLREELAANGAVIERDDGTHFLPTGAAASNCMPKGVWVPDATKDPLLYDEGAGPMTMAAEIHTAFMAGGFPFWDHLFRKRRFTSPLGVSPAFKELQPILLRDLVVPM